jgi:ATP adenylyltransferase
MRDCPFCSLSNSRIIKENNLAYAIRDNSPITPLHSLIITKRHVKDYFNLTKNELLACDNLIKLIRNDIFNTDINITGFNLGTNIGFSAGQKIFHYHVHLIPRKDNDSKPFIRWNSV